jgi:hypothetical protein
MRNKLVAGAAGACVALLAGCGGGGGGADSGASGGVPLTTRSDALREMGNFALAMLPATVASASASARAQSGTAAPSRLGPAHPRTRVEANTAETCNEGGTQDDMGGSKSRTFVYFPTTVSMDYQRTLYSNCGQNGGADSDGNTQIRTFDGVEEIGYDRGPYFYLQFGSSDAPFKETDIIKNPAGVITSSVQIQGSELLEVAYSSPTESRLSRSISVIQDQPAAFTGNFATGGSNGYFDALADRTGQIPVYTVGGTFGYSSSPSGCSGGEITLQTLQPLEIPDGDGSTLSNPVGGSIRIGSGTGSVTIAFNTDGSAEATFSAGGSTAISANDVRGAINLPACMPLT